MQAVDHVAKFNQLLARNKSLRFLDVLLKGYGQVLICLNPVTGLLLFLAIFYVSRTIWLLTLVGIVSSNLMACLLHAKTSHVRAGVYGFNGVVLGIAWLWFMRLDALSVVLLALGAALSSALMKFSTDRNEGTTTNLPVLSVPSLIVVWGLLVVLQAFFAHSDFLGPDRCIQEYLRGYEVIASSPSRPLAIHVFFRFFSKYILTALVILAGVRVHSRLSSLLFAYFLGITVLAIFCLGGFAEFKSLEFYLYNAVPCGIALGGTFLVLNRQVFLAATAGVLLTIVLTFLGMRYFPLPAFIAPFNLVVIGFLWLVKSGMLRREDGFCAVPAELVSSAEFGLEWHKGELYAQDYWNKVEQSLEGLR